MKNTRTSYCKYQDTSIADIEVGAQTPRGELTVPKFSRELWKTYKNRSEMKKGKAGNGGQEKWGK